jgi:hypothetical protein
VKNARRVEAFVKLFEPSSGDRGSYGVKARWTQQPSRQTIGEVMNNNLNITRILLAAGLACSISQAACDDGELITAMEKEKSSMQSENPPDQGQDTETSEPEVESDYTTILYSQMAENPNLMLFSNSIINYREPIFICLYDEQGNALTESPLGKYRSDGGIPYGEITAVEMPELGPVADQLLAIAYTVDGESDCLASLDQTIPYSFLTIDHYMLFFGRQSVLMPVGYVSSVFGAEEWFVCGENGDESCEPDPSSPGSGMAGIGCMNANEALPDQTALRFSSLTWRLEGPLTFCWDPDDEEQEPSVFLGNYPIPYEPPYTGRYELPPMTTGTIHLHLGEVDCAEATIANAAATLALPAPATFGPPGAQIAFDAGSSGTLVVFGTPIDGVPQDAGLRIVPLLNWNEWNE